MIQSDENLLCPACRKPVFSQPSVARCLQCKEFQHESCAQKPGRCAANATCKGKTEPCAVVRVPHAGPTREAIADTVRDALQHSFASMGEKLDAHSRTLIENAKAGEAKTETTHQELAKMSAHFDSAVAALDKALQTVVRVTRDIDKRTLYQPKPLSQKQLEESVASVADRVEELAASNNERAEARLTLLRAQLVPDLRAAVRAIEACRFDVVSARHPAPWAVGAEDVLAPAASVDLPREDLS